MQKLVRVYPRGWTGDSMGNLNVFLSNGWEVKFITPVGHDIYDYVIEKKDLIEKEV